MREPTDTGGIEHPAPHRDRVRGWIVTAGLFVAPATWLVQLDTSYSLGTAHCPGAPAGPAPGLAQGMIAGIGIAALLLAILALAAAARAWSATNKEGPGGFHIALSSGHGRTRFLALAGLIVSGIFLTAVGFLMFVPLFVRACGA